MRKLLVVAALFGILGSLRADGLGAQDESASCSATVQAKDLSIRVCDFAFSKHDSEHVTLLWDSAPLQAQSLHLAPEAISFCAAAILRAEGLKRFPKAKSFKVVVAEVQDRDSYGLPQWSSMKIVKKIQFEVLKNGRLRLLPPAP
jgi:hypothetical protein